MGNRRFFKFSYLIAQETDRNGRPHQLRDGDACTELAMLLSTLGYEYGGLILNTAVDTMPSFLQPSDLLILITRPPLDDQRANPRKHLSPSDSWLEQRVFAALRPYFDICSRDRVRLSQTLANQLPPVVMTRGEIEFKQYVRATDEQYVGATYKQYKKRDDLRWQAPVSPPRTALYLLYMPLFTPPLMDEAQPHRDKPPIFCHLLTVFGMGGTETLLWAYLLRTRFWREWSLDLDVPRFIMAEMCPDSLPQRPISLAFADTWPVDLLLNTTLPL